MYVTLQGLPPCYSCGNKDLTLWFGVHGLVCAVTAAAQLDSLSTTLYVYRQAVE